MGGFLGGGNGVKLSPSGINNTGIMAESIFNGQGKNAVNVFSNLGSDNPFKGPTAKSLFYEGAKRDPGKYGQFLFYSFGSNDNNFIDAYYKSETVKFNRRISSLESKNPSAGFLVRSTHNLESSASNSSTAGMGGKIDNEIVGGLSAPYYWKDFLYCKYYGAIPNNYMVTLRRFANPVLDNMSIPSAIKGSKVYIKEGLGRPVAQAVTWMGGNTGNTIKALTQFSTGLSWTPKTQQEMQTQKAFTKGAFLDKPYQWATELAQKVSPTAGSISSAAGGALSAAATGLDPNNTSIENLRVNRLRDLAKSQGGALSEYIWVSVDTVNKTYMRSAGLPFGWGGGGSAGSISLVFEYELTSVGEVNTKAAMLDILGNLLSIGTNYGNFLTPNFRYDSTFPALGFPGGDAGLEMFYRSPLDWFETFGSELMATLDGATSPDGNTAQGQITKNIQDPGSPDNGIKGQIQKAMASVEKATPGASQESLIFGALRLLKDDPTVGKDTINRILKSLVTDDFIANYQAPVAFFTGVPIGEWHLTIGNPCNPIAMIGNLICSNVAIEFGDTLGPDDFPTSLKATFTLMHARDRERGEIESIFNRGDGRLYQSSLSTSATMQSDNAYMDTAGNVGSYAAEASLNGDAYSNGLGPNIQQ
jgi:hypothetical protein